MKGYNHLERPVLNDSQSLVVELGMTFIQIIDVVSHKLTKVGPYIVVSITCQHILVVALKVP